MDMIDKLKNTIEILQDINKGLVEQLLSANERYAKLLEALSEDGGEQDTGSAQDDNEEKFKEEEEIVVPNLYDSVEADLKPILDGMEDLSLRVKDLCQDYEQIYLNVEDVNIGYNTFVKALKRIKREDEENIYSSVPLRDLLIFQLSEYGWTNILLRMYAYSKIKTFKYQFLNDNLQDIYMSIISYYEKFGIKIDLPSILEDDYNNTKHEYNNSSCILIENYCELSPSDYMNKIYDIIQVGYVLTDSADADEIRKPVIFYYS